MKPASIYTSDLFESKMRYRAIRDDFFHVHYMFYTIDTKLYTIEEDYLFEPEYGLTYSPPLFRLCDGTKSHREIKFKQI